MNNSVPVWSDPNLLSTTTMFPGSSPNILNNSSATMSVSQQESPVVESWDGRPKVRNPFVTLDPDSHAIGWREAGKRNRRKNGKREETEKKKKREMWIEIRDREERKGHTGE